jgi:hypothetical protein
MQVEAKGNSNKNHMKSTIQASVQKAHDLIHVVLILHLNQQYVCICFTFLVYYTRPEVLGFARNLDLDWRVNTCNRKLKDDTMRATCKPINRSPVNPHSLF